MMPSISARATISGRSRTINSGSSLRGFLTEPSHQSPCHRSGQIGWNSVSYLDVLRSPGSGKCQIGRESLQKRYLGRGQSACAGDYPGPWRAAGAKVLMIVREDPVAVDPEGAVSAGRCQYGGCGRGQVDWPATAVEQEPCEWVGADHGVLGVGDLGRVRFSEDRVGRDDLAGCPGCPRSVGSGGCL